MRRAAVVIAVLCMGVAGLGQDNSKQAAPPAGQAAGQAATQGKRPPQAKTKPEFDAFNAAMAMTDPAAQEKAADDFASKFPTSELRALLYRQGPLRLYGQAHNDDKALEMARKVLGIDPDDPEALLAAAQILSNRTKDSDADKDKNAAEAQKDAERALVTVDTDIPTAAYQPDQLAAYKANARSEAYSILGALSFTANKWAEAEVSLRKSIEALPDQPDPLTVYQLAVALDEQDKFAEAMKYADQAVNLTKDQPNSDLGKAARKEKDRVTTLNSGSAPGAPKK
jgi:tetratricopeptide (TPR) repeat protein